VEADEPIVEIATDKVDSEIPSPVDGVLIEILRQVNDVVPVGEVIAILETEGEAVSTPSVPQQTQPLQRRLVRRLEPCHMCQQKAMEMDLFQQTTMVNFTPLW